jgi:hypothetical protein
VLHCHRGEVCKSDDFRGNQLREFEFPSRVSFALLIELYGVTPATDLLTVLFSLGVVVDPPDPGPGWALEDSPFLLFLVLLAFHHAPVVHVNLTATLQRSAGAGIRKVLDSDQWL